MFDQTAQSTNNENSPALAETLLTRRNMLSDVATGLAGIALGSLLGEVRAEAAAVEPHHTTTMASNGG